MLLLQSVCLIIQDVPYWLVINPWCAEETVHKGNCIGQASLALPHPESKEVGALSDEAPTWKERSYRQAFLTTKLQLKENPQLEQVVWVFKDNWEAVSTREFDNGHTTAIKC